MSEAIKFFWELSVLAELAVAIRLLWQGLGGRYPALLTASLVFSIKSVLIMSAGSHTRVVWKALVPLDWILNPWIVFELFSCWTRSYAGIGRFGRFLFAIILAASVGLSLFFWQAEQGAVSADPRLSLFSFHAFFERFTFSTLGLFLAATMYFFRSFPEAIPPNLIRTSRIMTGYFLLVAMLDLCWNFAGSAVVFEATHIDVYRLRAFTNIGILVTSTLAFGGVAVLLTRQGQVPTQLKPPSPLERERIERINEDLLELMKRF